METLKMLNLHLSPENRGPAILGHPLLMSPLFGRDLGAFLEPSPRIICADGFSMSVQTGSGIYCTPRDNDGPWNEVEVGFPSQEIPEFMDYAEDADRPLHTVYGYVPIELVAQVIDNHGGFASPVTG